VVNNFAKFNDRCKKSPKGSLLGIFIGLFQFFLLWLYSKVKDPVYEANNTTVLVEIAIALNTIPTTCLNVGFVFFYTTVSQLLICIIDHLEDIFQSLQDTKHLLPNGANAEEILNIKVKVILKYAHQIHLRIIK